MNIDHRHRLQQPSWSSGFCSCGDNPGNCCITCILPCITFGQIAEVVDEGRTSCITHGVVYGLLMLIECHWLYYHAYIERKSEGNSGYPKLLAVIVGFISVANLVPFVKSMLSSTPEVSTLLKVGLGQLVLCLLICLRPCSSDTI